MVKEVLVGILKEEDEEVMFSKQKVDYDFLRETVNGYIEPVYELEDNGILIWGNEESKLIGCSPRFAIYDGRDIFCGPAIFINEKVDEDGESIYEDLTEKQIETIKEFYQSHKVDKNTEVIPQFQIFFS